MTAVASPGPLDAALLPEGIRSRLVPGVNGLTMHVLEAGFGSPQRPLLLLLHGFPELAYSWRKLMLPLAEAGYHVVAPDQRGYGRTGGWDPDYDGDLASYSMPNLVRDVLSLVQALGHRSAAAVVGHDFGSPVAAWCALIRPDIFRAVAMMSAPFAGPPPLSAGQASDDATGIGSAAGGGPASGGGPAPVDVHAELAALTPPRRHYQWYYATRQANEDMWRCPQGVHDFMRAYYHFKSADWPGNRPFPLAAWSADELAKLPTYYVMDARLGMAETVAAEMPSAQQVAGCRWLPDDELRVYGDEFSRTGFQGGLQWYRCGISPRFAAELGLFAGRTIDVPSCFIAGASDWGIEQKPGALAAMRDRACTDFRGCWLVEGAGHWVQQEQAGETTRRLLGFLGGLA
ncbi:MAG: alpha/beta hydrolase [Limnobacter sp.]|nr:alpha/beta hydrolase [Limnobacter sp.]